MIEINGLTKDYGDGKGIFNIDLKINKGEVVGFVGTNGAGKTTTIRHLMGFLKADKGSVTVNGLDCWSKSHDVKKIVGYIPGEIAFPDYNSGTEFLKVQGKLLGVRDMSYSEKIINMLQLDPTANLKRMSKGMKQKTAIVAALMADPEVLILDEPTTGLDPLMRAEFIKLIKEEKNKGKTILMSSHMFEEVEETCDRVVLIKDGKIIASKKTNEIKHNENKSYKVEFNNKNDFKKFIEENKDNFELVNLKDEQNQVTVVVHDSNINNFTKTLTNFDIKFFKEIKFTLEKYFKEFN